MQCTLGEHLSGLNTDILKSWLRRVDALEKGMTRKDDFIRTISEQLSNNLSGILKRLNLAERCFLAQCAHHRRFVSAREFEAKYNTVCPLPSMTVSYSAYSDAVGHVFQFLSDSIPGLPDSFRSEATLWKKS